jgi:actin-related protein
VPLVSLFSSSVVSAVGAGVRSALVVDLGWNETTVTSVYEYREVRCTRSVRGGKLLLEELHRTLRDVINQEQGYGLRASDRKDDPSQRVISFAECEDIACRLLWCRPSQESSVETPSSSGLPTVQEQDESDVMASHGHGQAHAVKVPLSSSYPLTSLDVPSQRLADVCERTFLEQQCSPASFDDHELPLHLLVYKHLLQLPMDVRAVCMPRIIFTGGCSKILGLKRRVFDEIQALVRERGWNPVQGNGVQQLKANQKLHRHGSRQAGQGPIGVSLQTDNGEEQDGVWHDAANAVPEADYIEEQLKKSSKGSGSKVHGVLRCIDSLGAWGGGSLVCQLKIVAMSNIDRDLWLQHGVNGASKASDVDVKTQQRQSMGPGGLMRGAAGGSQANWTLGTWGYT